MLLYVLKERSLIVVGRPSNLIRMSMSLKRLVVVNLTDGHTWSPSPDQRIRQPLAEPIATLSAPPPAALGFRSSHSGKRSSAQGSRFSQPVHQSPRQTEQPKHLQKMVEVVEEWTPSRSATESNLNDKISRKVSLDAVPGFTVTYVVDAQRCPVVGSPW